MLVLQTCSCPLFCSLNLPSLENQAQGNLGSPRVGPIRTGRSRTPGSVGGDVAQCCPRQAVFVSPAAGVVRRVEHVESLKRQVAGHALRKGQLLGQSGIDLADRIKIQIADGLEGYPAESAATTVQRPGDKSARERISGNSRCGVHGLRRLKARDLAELPVVDQVTCPDAVAFGERWCPHEVNPCAVPDIVRCGTFFGGKVAVFIARWA